MTPLSKPLLLAVMVAALAVPSAALANDERDDLPSAPECPAPTLRTGDGDDGCPKPPCPPAPTTTRTDDGGSEGERCVKPKPECPAPTGDVRAARNGCDDDGGRGGDRFKTKFRPSFLNRVWRFEGAADFYEAGVLGMTVEKVRGLPKRLRNQDDELLDQDALVLVSSKAKVFDKDGNRTTADALANADTVTVRGKLLPPAKWQNDEDGQATPTLRAKRVYVTG